MLGTTQIDVMAPSVDIRASNLSRPSKWLMDWAGGEKSDSGIEMSTDKALSYAPVVQAISVLAGDIGQLPLDLFKRTDERNKEKDREHKAFRICRRRANPYMSAATFRETMMLYVLLHGNAVAEIEWGPHRQPKYLWPLLPHLTHREVINSKLVYVTRIKESSSEVRVIRAENVLHISNFGPDGTWGYPTITMARNSWGLGLAGEKYANRYFKNNGTPSGVLEHPGNLGDPAYKRVKRDWKSTHEGLDNVARLAILEEGMKYNPIAFSQKDSQWLESRVHQKRDVASWFNLPPHKLGDMEDANYSNMVEAERHYLNTGLRRWEVKWEDESGEKLLTDREKDMDSHFFAFNNDALLQADTEARSKAYSTALGGHPWMTINEVRGKDNMNAVDDGDEIPEPLNMSTGQEAADETPDATNNSQAEAKLRELLTAEARLVSHAAKASPNFVEWVDAFYQQWATSAGMALDLPSGHPMLAHWIAFDKATCLGAAGKVTDKQQLHGVISATVAGWPLRANEFATQMEVEV